MNNNFYVYEWIRLDTNEPFYVGKGKGERAYSLKNRGKYFNNIVNKVPVAVVILHDNLTEEEAFQYESWYIHEYKYLGPYNLTNLTDGGDGMAGYKFTEEQRKRLSESLKGKNAGEASWMYGKRGSEVPGWGEKGSKHHRSQAIKVFKDGELYGEYGCISDFARELGSKIPNDPISNACRRLAVGWIPKRGRYVGFKIVKEVM